ncbi:MAG: insulinase family protein [Cyclobacteriaceae bacterium]|nr:insulinase family protein [Cyclobacteriaceae bacterium]
MNILKETTLLPSLKFINIPSMQSTLRKVICLLLFIGSNIAVLAQVNLTDPLPIDPAIKIGKLPNGLTYYIRKNVRPEKKAELRLVVNIGSIAEDDDQQGLAHFVEHMAFNGTKNFKKNELVSYLQSIGVKFGNDLNASTGFDETVYILPIPTENKETVEKAFQVLEDWASAIAFESGEIDKERGVILEEARLGKGAQDRMAKQFLPKVLAGSKYANRLPIGKEDIVQTFKYDAVKRFYRDWYVPVNMAVVVVGDIEAADAEALVKEHFEKLTNPTKIRQRGVNEIPVRTQSEGLVITDKENPNSILQVLYSPKKVSKQRTLKDYRESIIKNLFSQMLSACLQELTQKSEPPFVFGGSNLGHFVGDYETFASVALIGKAGPQAAITALTMENERARKFGFTTSELERTKKTMLKGIERAFNERDKTESTNFTSEYVRNFLQQEPIPGIENENKYYNQFTNDITLDEINQYAAATIPTADSKLVILMAPEKPDYELPTNEKLLAFADAATQLEVKPYEEKAVAASLMEEPPSAGRISFQKENKEVGFYELTLGNGIKVLLKPTTFKNDQIVLSGFRFGGQSNYDTKDRYNAENASTLIAQMGVGKFSPTDLSKTLAGKTVSASPQISSTEESISGSSSVADLETMLQLVHLYFTQPRKDEELFKSYLSKQQAMVQNILSNPQAVFQDSLFSIIFKNHPRAPKLPRAADYDQVNIDRVIEIYKERFSNANGFTFVITGSFTMEKIKPLIATYLASLPSDKSKTFSYKDIGLRPVRGTVKKEVKKGTEDKSFITIQFNGEAPYSPTDQMNLQVFIEIMNIKLTETLREKMSGAYTGGMNGSISKHPYQNYSIGVFIPCGPKNVDKLITATIQEIEKVKKNGPTAQDLAKVKENWKKQYLEKCEGQ